MRVVPIVTAVTLTIVSALPAAAQSRTMIYDANGDGVLTENEFRSGPMNLGSFSLYDRDSTGTVTLSEFMRGLADRLEGKRDDGTLTPMDARTLRVAVMAFG